jgi:hypothetical protein
MMKLTGTIKHKFEVSPRDVGRAVLGEVARRCSVEDDAGCDYLTDADNHTYIGSRDWRVSSVPNIAALVDAANILISGNPLKLDAAPFARTGEPTIGLKHNVTIFRHDAPDDLVIVPLVSETCEPSLAALKARAIETLNRVRHDAVDNCAEVTIEAVEPSDTVLDLNADEESAVRAVLGDLAYHFKAVDPLTMSRRVLQHLEAVWRKLSR